MRNAIERNHLNISSCSATKEMRDETARETNKSLVTKLQLAFTVETVSCTPVIFTFLFRCKRSGNLNELINNYPAKSRGISPDT